MAHCYYFCRQTACPLSVIHLIFFCLANTSFRFRYFLVCPFLILHQDQNVCPCALHYPNQLVIFCPFLASHPGQVLIFLPILNISSRAGAALLPILSISSRAGVDLLPILNISSRAGADLLPIRITSSNCWDRLPIRITPSKSDLLPIGPGALRRFPIRSTLPSCGERLPIRMTLSKSAEDFLPILNISSNRLGWADLLPILKIESKSLPRLPILSNSSNPPAEALL